MLFVTPGYAEEAGQPATAGEGATEAGTEHGEAKGPFPPFDPTHFPSQILWLAIIFGLFYIFLKRVALPRVGNILEVRRERIAHDLDQAAKMKGEADAAVAAYEQELAEARGKANTIGQKARDDAKAEADAKRKQVEAGLEKKLADAEAQIARIKASALAEVGTIATGTASEIIEHLIGQKADRAAVAAAVKSASE
jgi:F-type H+-transporting ATPase subunit b